MEGNFLLGENGDLLVAGNAPFIVDRKEGAMHSTGTAFPLELYPESYDRTTRLEAVGLHPTHLGPPRERQGNRDMRHLEGSALDKHIVTGIAVSGTISLIPSFPLRVRIAGF